ncbi:unnamed protein product [Soboliphyme baturini]|uniref:Transmembrane protein 14C n=1 Tax=Soboliphyme baturini TaxID=241478 RepID=A0A183IGT1_9BILA|nr:unnamed protein product [Soboliphyme baturini]
MTKNWSLSMFWNGANQSFMDMPWFIRLAGLSGAAAICLGAFSTGTKYHLLHSAVLLASSFSNRPRLTAALLSLGMAGFCGGCYGFALADSQLARKITPFGGITLILAWLSFAL